MAPKTRLELGGRRRRQGTHHDLSLGGTAYQGGDPDQTPYIITCSCVKHKVTILVVDYCVESRLFDEQNNFVAFVWPKSRIVTLPPELL